VGASLLAAVTTDEKMISKVRGIQAKMDASAAYSKAMTMERLVHFVKDNPQVQIDLEGAQGQEVLVFHADVARRWRILKLLDDDYLFSKLTELDYEANSKTPLKGV
jgi:hypothetical protein